MDPDLARKIAENESRFRVANEKIEAGWLNIDPDPLTVPFVCECGRLECLQTLRLTIEEYEFARSDGTYFLCVPGHEITVGGVGRVVQETRNSVIVQKLGVAGAVAEATSTREDEEVERAG